MHTVLCHLKQLFFFPFPVKGSRRRSRVSPLLRLLTLGLSGRFWLHASLPRFRQIGFLWPWQSLALPLAVILGFLSLMEAQTVSSIHRVTPPAAGGPSGSLTTGQSQSLMHLSLRSASHHLRSTTSLSRARSRVPVVVYTSSGQKYQSLAMELQPDSEKGRRESTFHWAIPFLCCGALCFYRKKTFLLHFKCDIEMY